MSNNKIIIHLITGFLGSGKTTLLHNIINAHDSSDIAILVNEIGEIGIDHLIFQEITDDVVLLKNGCICCNINESLANSLHDLYNKSYSGDINKFKTVFIETTGLANPSAIISTLLHDPKLVYHFSLGSIITVVDAINFSIQEKNNFEWEQQVAAADYLLISKSTKLETKQLSKVHELLKVKNVFATIDICENFINIFKINNIVHKEQNDDHYKKFAIKNIITNNHLLNQDTQTCSIEFNKELPWANFSIWLSMILHSHGDKILRFKGIIKLIDGNQTILLNGVQHTLHPPQHLSTYTLQSSYLIFICRQLDINLIKQSFYKFNNIRIDEM